MTESASRYATMFETAAAEGKHVVIPYFTTGDPSPERFLELVDASVDAGAGGFELGIAFSDPSADGPANQDAMSRALAQGIDKDQAFALISEIRTRHPHVPIGLLVYANLVYTPETKVFYERAAAAGVDSVLIADVPLHLIDEFKAEATAAGVQTVLIAPPNATDDDLRDIAQASEGYVYLVSRAGVTGVDRPADAPVEEIISTLHQNNSAPVIVAFGVSKPEHVRHAVSNGAAGVIAGSVFSNLIAEHLDDQPALIRSVQALIRSFVTA